MYIYNRSGELLFSSAQKSADSIMTLTHEMVGPFIEHWRRANLPCVLQDEYGMTFGFVGVDDVFCIWGPFSETPINITELHQIMERYGLKARSLYLPTASLFRLITEMEIVFLFLTGRQLRQEDIIRATFSLDSSFSIQETEIDQYRFSNSENETHRISRQFEQSVMDAVRNGDIDFLQNLPFDVGYERAGILAKSKKKHMEYMTVSGITMVTRAAMEGGI